MQEPFLSREEQAAKKFKIGSFHIPTGKRFEAEFDYLKRLVEFRYHFIRTPTAEQLLLHALSMWTTDIWIYFPIQVRTHETT